VHIPSYHRRQTIHVLRSELRAPLHADDVFHTIMNFES
jgi:hypothetical protein